MKRGPEFNASENEPQKQRKLDQPPSEISLSNNNGIMMGGNSSSSRPSTSLSNMGMRPVNSSPSPTTNNPSYGSFSPLSSSSILPSSSNDNLESNQEKVSKQKHAMDFLYKVRDQYSNNPSTYNEFLEIMKGFKSGSIETSEVIHRVKELFKGNEYLIEEFNLFLPPGFKIESELPLASTESGPNVAQGDLEQARNYVRKIKNRFAMQPQIYKTFLEILHGYYQGQHAIADVLNEVAELFQNHNDLLVEFQHFLPKSANAINPRPVSNSATTPPTVVNKKQKKKLKEKSEKLHIPEKAIEKTDKVPLDYNSSAIQSSSTVPVHQSVVPSSQTPTIPPKRKDKDEKKVAPLIPEEKKKSKKEEKKKEPKYTTVISPISQEKKEQPQVHPPSLPATANGQTSFTPTLFRAPSTETNSYSEFSYYREVKQRLKSKYLYHQFLSAISLYSQGIITKAELMYLTHGILIKHRDLYECFKNFIGFHEFDETNNFGDPVTQSSQLGDDLRELNSVLNETNATITMLESVVEKSNQTNTPITLTKLDVNYIQHIEKIYGSRGSELLEALFNNPTTVVPIVLRRLKQKYREWEELRSIVRRRATDQQQ